MKIKALLEDLGIYETNHGLCAGSEDLWLPSTRTRCASNAFASINPTTNEPIAWVDGCSDFECERVVQEAEHAFKEWRMIPAPQRGEVIHDLMLALTESKEQIGDLVSLETGKIRTEGHGEVQEMIDICKFATGLSRQLYGLTMPSERPRHTLEERWHPLGPIGIITAFNFPVAVWAWNAAIAAVCGNTMIWKPSPLAPLTAIAVQHIVNPVMADHHLSGVFNLCVGHDEIGEAMINDSRLPLISFTGSVATGRYVAQTVAGRLGKTILELGGNNATIVDETADLDLAVRAIVFGAAGTAGQRCTTTRRLIAHESVTEKLIKRLVRAYKKLPIGDPLNENTLVGPLINREAVENMKEALARAEKEGGKILCGGQALPDIGPNFVQPAIIKMPAQNLIVHEETFAPILYVMEYEDFEGAIEMQNAVPQGFSSALFTESMRESEKFLSPEGSDCGIANINVGTSGAEIGGAFGGEKDTGGGRESGSDAWKAYMRRQTITRNWSGELPLAQGVKFDP